MIVGSMYLYIFRYNNSNKSHVCHFPLTASTNSRVQANPTTSQITGRKHKYLWYIKDINCRPRRLHFFLSFNHQLHCQLTIFLSFNFYLRQHNMIFMGPRQDIQLDKHITNRCKKINILDIRASPTLGNFAEL